MGRYPAICKVYLCWWDGEKTYRSKKVILVSCDNYADAAKQIEEYAGDELEKVEIELFAEGMIEFPMSDYEHIHQVMSDYI